MLRLLPPDSLEFDVPYDPPSSKPAIPIDAPTFEETALEADEENSFMFEFDLPEARTSYK